MPSHPNQFSTIDDELLTVTGGRGNPQHSQEELRQMAKDNCPTTYRKHRNAKEITRPMAERCLEEAGYGWAKFKLNEYFPRT